jgi:hypothetical protein
MKNLSDTVLKSNLETAERKRNWMEWGETEKLGGKWNVARLRQYICSGSGRIVSRLDDGGIGVASLQE